MTEQTEQTQQEQAPSWLIDEGLPGSGARPAWLPDKFKSVADMAKAHSELEKRLGTAPDEYDFSKSKYLDPDYAPFEEVKKIAKEKRVPQEVIDAMLGSVDKYMDEFSTDYGDEMKKLGDNAEQRVNTLENWAKANLSKESFEVLGSSLRTADQIKALEELRGKMMSDATQIPTGNGGQITQPATVAELQHEIVQNFEKYKTDDGYRKDVQRRLDAAVKSSPGTYVDKMGA
jgi:hypothetical protein